MEDMVVAAFTAGLGNSVNDGLHVRVCEGSGGGSGDVADGERATKGVAVVGNLADVLVSDVGEPAFPILVEECQGSTPADSNGAGAVGQQKNRMRLREGNGRAAKEVREVTREPELIVA